MQFNGDDSHFALAGDLMIRGATQPIVLDGELHGVAVDGDGHERVALARRGQLEPADYGLVWSCALETGGADLGADRGVPEVDEQM